MVIIVVIFVDEEGSGKNLSIQAHVAHPKLVGGDVFIVLVSLLACLLLLAGQLFLFLIGQREELETEAVDFDLGASDRRTHHGVVVSNEWVLIVLVDLLAHCRVDYFLA